MMRTFVISTKREEGKSDREDRKHAGTSVTQGPCKGTWSMG